MFLNILDEILPLRRAPVCAALLRCLVGFGGGLGVTPPRRSYALCGGCGGVMGGQSVQYAAVFGGDGAVPKMLMISSIRTALPKYAWAGPSSQFSYKKRA